MEIVIHNEAELSELANNLWNGIVQNKSQAVIFALEGELGSGKTTFTKHLARAAGITEIITSPTFILHDEYPNFDHIDTWRMEDPQELFDLGIENMIKQKHVIVIEWADRMRSQILGLGSQSKIVWIKFEHKKRESERRVLYEDLGN